MQNLELLLAAHLPSSTGFVYLRRTDGNKGRAQNSQHLIVFVLMRVSHSHSEHGTTCRPPVLFDARM